MTTRDADTTDLKTDAWMQLNNRPAVRMTRGQGHYLWDHTGKRYLDFVQGWAVNALGHAPAALRAALTRQLEQVINVGPAFHNEPALRLATRLAQQSGLAKCWLQNSGCEANDAAAKLARKWGQQRRGGAYEVITAWDGFHGRTLAMTTATGKAGFHDAFPPTIAGFPKVPYGDLTALRARIRDETAAVMLEPIQGEAGVVPPPTGYLKAVRELCDERGVLLILDEIQTGIARTGPLFAHQHDGVRPDIMTLGKGLGGGLPIAALCASAEAACFEPGDHGGTFCGNALCSAAALAVLDVIESPEHRELRRLGSALLEARLGELARDLGANLRGRGHLWALVLPEPNATALRDRAFEAGVLVNAPRPHIVRLMPALDVGEAELDALCAVLRRVATAHPGSS